MMLDFLCVFYVSTRIKSASNSDQGKMKGPTENPHKVDHLIFSSFFSSHDLYNYEKKPQHSPFK